MKKLTFTLLLSFALFSFMQAQTVLFDPADWVSETLPAGWEVVDIDGESYMQVIVDGWNSSLDLPEITTWEGNGVISTYKYAMGPDTDDTLTLADINSSVKIADTVNTVPASWDPATMVPSESAMGQSPTAEGFQLVTGAIPAEMKLGHFLQVSGQQTKSWGPTVGDTVWFGKISTYDATVMFDPASYPADMLPDNMEIVDDGGEKLLKITIDGWDNVLDLIPSFKMNENNQLVFKQKVEVGTSGVTVADMNYWIGGNDTDATQQFTKGELGSADLTEVEVPAKSGIELGQLQFTIQQNSGDWPALTGAILYISKITVKKVVDVILPPRVTYTVPHTMGEEITLDGLQLEDAWFEADQALADQAVSMVDGESFPSSDADNSGKWYALYDADFLYLYIDVTDDVIVPMTDPDADGAQVWMNDGVEIFVDILDRRIANKRISSEQHQLRFNIERESADTSALAHYVAGWGDIKGATSYQLEIALPWGGICQGAVDSADVEKFVADSIKAGKEIAFEISIIDAEPENARKSLLNWSNDTGEDQAYENSEFYGQLVLGASSATKKVERNLTAKVYPNPANSSLTVSLEGMTSIAIYNITGQQVMVYQVDNDITTVNVSSLSAGMYMVEVNTDNGIAIQKVTIR